MRTKLAVFALLGASLLFLPLAHRAAEAASGPPALNAITGSAPELIPVAHFGGGGGFGGGGMGHMGGGGMGHIGGNFSGAHVYGGGHFAGTGGVYPGHAYGSPRYANRGLNHAGPHGRYGNHYDNRHYAENGHNHNHYYRHRVYRNGAWVWVYGPGYYYGPDYYAYAGECYWLRQQAYATGSPYWWSRYNACLGYY